MTRPAEPRPRPGRLAVLLACAVLVAAACGPGCARQPVPGGATSSKANQARQQAEKTAMAGAKAAGEFVATLSRPQQTTPTAVNTPVAPQAPSAPTPPVAPRTPSSPTPPIVPSVTARPTPPVRPTDEPLIRERVSSLIAHPTEAEAEKDALEQAAGRMTEKLTELDPPVRYQMSAAEVKSYIRKDSKSAHPPTAEQKDEYAKAGIKDANLVFVEYEVTVSAEQVRELRSRERVLFGLKILAGVAAAALAGFLFLRADEWTKGYLTSWLAVAAFALAGGVAATLALV
jgi:hypothetical protein